ncbi:CYTH domain-containing protein [Myroides ceti]|uniref:CYTH domain-containing protein n=1 Tax=Paenimyroides ceti TaxID=395087 RepID=A0ABT8CN14_9FLAO|nr:CYTH domain-containing protein [Paenimyroides ceti]MDN3705584.1 CYTH domain-containing protein [Paenimyroides ceti]
MIEIERKYKVKNTNFLNALSHSFKIAQGYLNTHPERTVRIRTRDDKAYITIKGKSNEKGTSRLEWEKEINPEEAQQLLMLCEDFIIEKTRYIVPYRGHTFEIDVFSGLNEGLIIAEIELSHEDEIFEKPEWLGEEVTGDVKYYNAYLSNHPYNNWN